jgi:tRNA A64-2'-O-ribosylphosphate transferase
MPDALSKTVPIWCAVLNHALFPTRSETHKIHVPPQVVSDSELSQIESRFITYTEQFDALSLDMSQYKRVVLKPLRPIWVIRDSILPDHTPDFPEFYPIVLCTASRRVQGAEISEFGYIQGAGDDSEAWSEGLTAAAFWRNRDKILITPEEELPFLIQSIMNTEESDLREIVIRPIVHAKDIILTQNVHLTNLGLNSNDFVIFCSASGNDPLIDTLKTKHIQLECRNGKLGSRDLRKELYKLLASNCIPSNGGKLYVSCPDGKDICIGIALAIICLFVDDQGNFIQLNEHNSHGSITKRIIRQRLGWIMISFPDASPSRTTLQSVNDFLFSSVALLAL